MNTKTNLIFVNRNGRFEDKTKEIKFCEYSDYDGKCTVIFNNNRRYTYNSYNVKWYSNPTVIAPSTVRLFSKGKLLFDINYISVFKNEYWHIVFDTFEKTYHCSELKIEKSCLTNENAKSVFNYLKLIADEISVKTEDDNKILTNQYNSMENFISNNTVAYNYLLAQKANQFNDNEIVIFPFGSNSSQTTAVKNALTNQVSIIEGPPGTGNIFKDFPVIIFDDFTTESKYVDFPFKVKSSAMKILHINTDLVLPKYAFYLMQATEVDDENHQRYWISIFSQEIIALPPIKEQERIPIFFGTMIVLQALFQIVSILLEIYLK